MKRTGKSFTLGGFIPGKRGTEQVLGELQTAVIEILWKEPNLTVSEVEQRLQSDREIAHTTVQTILDRMHRKGLLEREKQGKAFLYRPASSKSEFEQNVAQEVLHSLLSQYTEPALSAFVELIGDDSEKLDHLEALIKEKKKRKEDKD